MRILNFGSLNIDHVYRLPRFAQPGETLASQAYQRFCGGKGGNQSIALALAGANVCHAGLIGGDGLWLKDFLHGRGVDTSLIEQVDEPSGHAVIQVTPNGENTIILHGGANRKFSRDYITRVLAGFDQGDFLLIQNETNGVAECLEAAAGLGMRVFFNPAPMDPGVPRYPLETVDCFIINETEGRALTDEKEPDRILSAMVQRYPRATTVLTWGDKGVLLAQAEKRISLPAEKVTAVDATAAGDTFIGFFIAALMKGQDMEEALGMANRAAALCVTRPGAAESIPTRDEVKHHVFPDTPPQKR